MNQGYEKGKHVLVNKMSILLGTGLHLLYIKLFEINREYEIKQAVKRC